jgi:hypothetical protein
MALQRMPALAIFRASTLILPGVDLGIWRTALKGS